MVCDVKLRVEIVMKSISFAFDEKKATQCAALLLSLNHGRMNYMKLIKLLYLSDRKAILSWSDTITTDRYVSMPKGPVTSCIYDKIKSGVKDDGSYWSCYIRTVDFEAVLINKSISDDCLSEMEIETIKSVYEKFKDVNEWDMVEYCHENIPEWRNPGSSSIPISIEDILSQKYKGKEYESIVEEMLHTSFIQINNFQLENGVIA